MPTFRALPLRWQLLIAILLLLVPFLGTTLWSGVATYQERVDDLREESRIIAFTTAALVNRDLMLLDRQAQAVTAVPFVQALDPVLSAALLRRVLPARPNVGDMLLARPDGSLVARGAHMPLPADPGVKWVREVIEQDTRVIVSIPGPRGAPQHLVLGYPVHDAAGRPVGALGHLVNLQTIQEALAAFPLPQGSVITILDDEGRALARSREPEQYVGQVLHRPGLTLQALPPQERMGPDGVARMYGEAVADQGPWLVSVGVPMAVAIDKATSLWLRSFAVLGLGIGGWLFVALVLSRRLSAGVSHLEAAAQQIAGGNFAPMPPRPMLSREFVELQSAFDLMLQRFNATRATLDEQMAEERRIRQELESLQGQVIRQERLAAVGQLVSGVAHEINNPLQAILGFSELLQMQTDVPEGAKADLRLIQKESARACGIIRNLALFARQQPGEAAPLRLVDVITSVAELRQRRLESEDIRLEIDDRSTQQVMAVATELQQVVLNFVINAEQAIIASGRLPGHITIRTFDSDGRVVLEAEDTGPGVPPQHEAKLFQPFFTTKPVGHGTGLGLSVSYGIIDSLGGQIGYRRAVAGGSIFYFSLPAVAAGGAE